MALLESPEDHVPISSGELTVCLECGGEWPCSAAYFRDKVQRLELALTRVAAGEPTNATEWDTLDLAALEEVGITSSARLIAWAALGERAPDPAAVELDPVGNVAELRALLDAARGAGDRAISVAVALHNQNAVYEKTAGPFMKRLAEEAGAHSGPDPWVDVETLRAALADAEHQLRRIRALAPLEGMERELRGPNDHSDAQIIAYHGAERCREALAATDPARTER